MSNRIVLVLHKFTVLRFLARPMKLQQVAKTTSAAVANQQGLYPNSNACPDILPADNNSSVISPGGGNSSNNNTAAGASIKPAVNDSGSTNSIPITQEQLKKWRENFYSEPKNLLAQNVCSRVDPFDVCLSRKALETTNHVFNYKVETEGKPVTNQRSSGRCWLFAALNCIRLPFMKNYNLDEFEFSQAFLFYWDKIERCNYFLNNIVKTAQRGEKVDGRLVSFLLLDPTSDGGQWDMLVNLIVKHGLMPKKCFPESFSCESSIRLNAILKSKVSGKRDREGISSNDSFLFLLQLREYARHLRVLLERQPSEQEIANKIQEQMSEIYKVVGICLGIPAETFTWEYYDKSKNYQSIGPISSLEFYERYVKPHFNVEDKVCLVTDPRPTSSYDQAYTVDCLGNVVGGRPVLYNNQSVELLLAMVTKSLKAGEAVWFGCEVSKRFASKQGIEDVDV